ncbi:hypothetical protein TSUD_257490 [Trifolium subterraneum]|uniref:Uncharacterized protein n=1 Tax=Trifolium subterraneum TaxID=3900 RepID=A0A2Z6MNE8_TRISU|nr:hypothetical protein TSUD_257490 [Trifolium subterraneum]
MSSSEILQELESLKNEKTKIEHKISLLEAQLKDINLQKQVSASSNGSSPYATNGLEPHMIHRYSRHLVLPSFGVQERFQGYGYGGVGRRCVEMGVLVVSRLFVWEEELVRQLLDRLASVNLSLEEDRWVWGIG